MPSQRLKMLIKKLSVLPVLLLIILKTNRSVFPVIFVFF